MRPQRVAQQRSAQQRLAEQRAHQQRLRQAAGLGRPPLLEDKLRVPRLTLEVLRRRRVTGLIEAAVTHRVTVVSGPAGAGKTVACAAWAAARPAARQPAWLTVDAEDRDPARFWPYVLAALVRARAVGADEAAQLAEGPPEDYPLRIVAAARSLAEPVVLVIDDAHELAGGGALAGLDLLIKHAPAGLRLVLSGRCGPPGLALSRLRVAGEVADVGAADLACTPEEADAYVAMLGLALTPAQRAELATRTQGWMAGLRLALMSGPGDAAPPGTPAPAVIDYVRDEVLARQSAQTRAFLLKTSVAASLPGGLADALTGGSGTGARTLERLARENILVEPSGSGYRYHPMLREVLSAELRRERPDEVPVLLGRAARWHAARGEAVEAVRIAARAGDWEFGVHLLAQAGAGVLAPDGPAELESVLAAFPAEYRAGAAPVAAALAAARLWQGDAAGAAPHLDCAQRSLGGLDGEARAVVAPWVTALLVMQGADPAGAGPGGLPQSWPAAERASAAAASVPQYRAAGLLWFAIGCGLLRRWEARPAALALTHASAQLAAGSLPELRARALAWQALAAAGCGELAAADRLIAEAAASPAAGQREVACPVALARAQVCVARDELGAAAERLDEADRLAGGQAAGEPSAAAVGGLIRAYAVTAESDPAGAAASIARLRAARAPGDEALGALLAVLEAGVALAAGERERAGLVLAGDGAPDGPPGAPSAPAPGLAAAAARLGRARLLLATGDDKGALETVEHWLDGTDPSVTLSDQVSALLVAAVARRRLSQVTEAAEHIEQALLLAEPEGAYRVFLDGGPPVRSAMTVLVPPTSRCAGFAGRVLERFGGQPPRLATAAPSGAAGLPLTGSELAVLRFLPSHMTNQEIAEALFLSINTVKTHLRSAYRKLGVANRRQAIARGRRLDLL
ncbi:MAG TPA: LuxR C-terminal-related transcriptional regulator [Streptosporangiaceae bacterium]|nr:LuxR C-terminal-related transcriptional regulator [Streptosporangiaceae bacterium]